MHSTLSSPLKDQANMSVPSNFAAWSLEPRGDLVVRDAPMYTVEDEEILIKVSPFAPT
jgi:hypothetical protein